MSGLLDFRARRCSRSRFLIRRLIELSIHGKLYLDRVKRIWYLSPMRAAKVQASLRIRAVSPEPSLLAHTSSESRGTFRQKAKSLAPLNGWACAVEICHDGMLEDTNSLDGAHLVLVILDGINLFIAPVNSDLKLTHKSFTDMCSWSAERSESLNRAIWS